MGEAVGRPRWEAAASSLLAAAGFATLSLVVAGAGTTPKVVAAGAGALFLGAVAVRRPVFAWENVLAILVLVILFLPIRRYRIPGDLPFQLEPYRVLVGLIVGGWIASLLVDPRVRLRRGGVEGPIVLILATTVASVLVNPDRLSAFQPTVLKSLTFLLSFVVLLYLVVSVARRPVVDVLAKTLVAGGAVVALLAVLEARTGLTPFTRLDSVIPFLIPDPSFNSEIGRGGAVRAFGPAEHPIALGAALVMLIPFAIYIVRISSPRWYLALVALTVGVLATVSRTGIIMLLVMGVVFLALRPRETRRLWPLLVPLLVATHFAVPGTLGALKQSFLPEGGLIEQQRASEGSCSSAGRVADLAPTLAEVAEKPFLGYGYGTRIVTGPDANACILDNQWLGTLVEVGIFGLLAWLWLFLRVLHRFGGIAKRDESSTGWLLVAVTASVSAYAVGMFTFDALSFVQVSLLLFIVLGLGAAAAGDARRPFLRPL